MTIVHALLAGAASAAAVVASVRRLRRARSLPDAAALDVALRGASPERARELAARGGDFGVARELLQRVLDAPSREHAVAEMNEYAAELSADLAAVADPRAVHVRVAAAAGLVLGLLDLADRLTGSAAGVPATAVAAWAAGGIGALGCAQLGRLADGVARQRREAHSSLSSRVERLAPARSRTIAATVDPRAHAG